MEHLVVRVEDRLRNVLQTTTGIVEGIEDGKAAWVEGTLEEVGLVAGVVAIARRD